VQPPPADLVRVIHQALRDLNNVAKLARSRLMLLLPRSVGQAWQEGANAGEPSMLEQAHLLRNLLVDAIERLNVADEGSKTAYEYLVLRMQYVQGMNVAQIAIRLSMAEANLFKYSANGRQAIAEDLWRREQQLATPRGEVAFSS
jgi:hypothetical protein